MCAGCPPHTFLPRRFQKFLKTNRREYAFPKTKSMRINLSTPFAEKEEVKALGAKWDASKKTWYIADVDDLTPFLRWIPNAESFAASVGGSTQKPKASQKAVIQRSKASSITEPASYLPHCGCDVLLWEHCIHTKGVDVLKAAEAG
jgi:hypothetical protein